MSQLIQAYIAEQHARFAKLQLELPPEFIDQERLGLVADALPVADAQLVALAKNLFQSGTHNFQPQSDCLLLKGQIANLKILTLIRELALAQKFNFEFCLVDDELEAYFLENATRQQLDQQVAMDLEAHEAITHRISVKQNPSPKLQFDPDKLAYLSRKLTTITDSYSSGKRHYTLTVIPTVADAELDNLAYADYLALFFEACNQPWPEIRQAQAILIEQFNQGREVKISNSDGTDLTFDISDMTFVNSVTLKNIPGSEFFSAPKREGVSGKLVAKGNFHYGNYGLIKDITLNFESGRVVNFSATEGEAILAKIIAADDGHGEGSRHLGELAFGTNPRLKTHMVNSLLVEKIGHSFHVALGKCYTYTNYDGQTVRVNNGNESYSGIHWDITTMLGGKDGKVYLDGILIQDNGIWVDTTGKPDPRLKVLNG